MVLYGRDGTIVAGNEASRTVIREDLADFNSGRHIDGDELKRAQAHFEAALSGEQVEFETQLTSRDGEPINIAARLFPALVDGKVVGVFGSGRDITAQRAAEASRDASREQFRALFEEHPDSISMVDAGGRYVRLNAAAERVAGYRSEELLGRHVGEVFPAREHGTSEDLIAEILRTGNAARYERSLELRDGSRLTIEGTAVPIVLNQRVKGAFLISRDVTHRKQFQEALALLTRRMRRLQRQFMETGSDPNVQAESMIGFSLKELGFESAFVVAADDDFTVERNVGSKPLVDAKDPVVRKLLRDTIEASGLLEVDGPPGFFRSFVGLPLDVGTRRLGVLGFATHLEVLPLSDFEREFLRSTAELVSANIERLDEEKRLQGLAHYDALTGLPNRRLLSEQFERDITVAKRCGEQIAVYFIDVDKFKSINDAHGHLVGDEVLRTIARRLLKACRTSDTVARLAGDEFVVLGAGRMSGSRSRALATRLRTALEAPCEIEGLRLCVTVGIGISVFPADGCDQLTLLKKADNALYAAKAAGRGSIRQFGADGSARSLRPVRSDRRLNA